MTLVIFSEPNVVEGNTVVLGISVPSADPLFLGVVGLHVALGISAVAAGAIAMLSPKGRGRHTRFALVYFWSLFGLFVTMTILSFMRWAEDYALFVLGAWRLRLPPSGERQFGTSGQDFISRAWQRPTS